jgi:hypothetical protein
MSQQYAKLKKIWYAKLKDSGFIDIEPYGKFFRGGSLKWKFNPNDETGHSKDFKAKEEYHYLARQLLNENVFKTNLHKIIWEYHSEGISTRDIAKLLKDAKVRTMHWTTIHKIIQSYRKLICE